MTVVPEPGAPTAPDHFAADPAAPDRAVTDPAAPDRFVTEPGSAAAAEVSGPTGHPAVDAALAELDAAADLDPAQQVPAYEQAHRALSQTLAAIDQS